MIRVNDVYKKYNENVLEGISFSLNEGEVLAIGGRNGSGKSTLLKIITGITKSDKGSVFIKNENINNNFSVIKNNIGYVSQENSLFDDLTVKDNLKLFSNLSNVIYKDFELEESILNKKIKELSGGMKKQINILVSLLKDPPCLIFDEPTANLDLYYKEKIFDIIKNQKRKGKSVIFTSHNDYELQLSDNLLIIKDGKIVFYNSPSKLMLNDNFKQEFLKLI